MILENVLDVLIKLPNTTPVNYPFSYRTMVHKLQYHRFRMKRDNILVTDDCNEVRGAA